MGSQWEPGNKQAMVKRWSKTHWGLPSLWQKTDVWFKTGVWAWIPHNMAIMKKRNLDYFRPLNKNQSKPHGDLMKRNPKTGGRGASRLEPLRNFWSWKWRDPSAIGNPKVLKFPPS